MLTEWNDLETYEGTSLKPYHDHAKTVGRIALKYASITGLALSIASLAVAVA